VVRGAVVRPEVALAHGLRPGSLADL